MIGLIAKWVVRAVIGLVFLGGLYGCTQLGLNYSSLETADKPVPTPSLDAEFDAAQTRAIFEQELYGPWPENLAVRAATTRMIDDNYLGGRATLEEVVFTIGTGPGARQFPVVLALPKTASDTPVPLILSQTFASNCSAFPGLAVTAADGTLCEGSEMTGFFGLLATQIFGTYIAKVPVERYVEAGIGYASFYGSSFVPDSAQAAPAVMAGFDTDPAPTGTLISWAYGFAKVAEQLKTDPRIRSDAVAALGHSRFGKSALIASAWSGQIDAAIAHQSGFAGAASSRSATGETLVRMAKSYPHWLKPGLAARLEDGHTLTLDQHYMLALSAPKPVFLGNGRRDVWSDPNSTFRIAQAADPVYREKGVTGLGANTMRMFKPGDGIAYWLRVGGHSVVSEDIDAFIAFMRAHFGTPDDKTLALQTGR